jgi:hypothetical protein
MRNKTKEKKIEKELNATDSRFEYINFFKQI